MRRILLVGLGIALGLAVLEVGLRLPEIPEPSNGFGIRDPVLHHGYRPNKTGVLHGVPFTTNSLGWRDREYPPVKPPGTFRILMLGDSFTEGRGLQFNETIPKRLEAGLNRNGCGRAWEVINAGISSYSPVLEYLLLKRHGLSLNPDFIIVNFDMTDVHDDFIRTRATALLDAQRLPRAVPMSRYREGALLVLPLPKPSWLRFLDPVEAVVNRSAVYQRLRGTRLVEKISGTVTPERLEALGLTGNIQYDVLAITRDTDSATQREAWALTERYIRGMHALAAERGIPFVLVVYPHAHQLSEAESPSGRRRLGIGPGLFTSERPFEILENLGRREGFPVINLLPVFRARLAEGPLFFPSDFHLNATGAKIFADGLLADLRERRLLPCDVAPTLDRQRR